MANNNNNFSFTPDPPKGKLGAYGKKVWERAWASPTVSEEDYDTILQLATLEEEYHKITLFFKKNEEIVLINGGTNIVLHPFKKRQEVIEKITLAIKNQLGLTPEGRKKLGLVEVVEDELDIWLKSRSENLDGK